MVNELHEMHKGEKRAERLTQLRKRAESIMSSKETTLLEMTFPNARQMLHDLDTYQIELELQNEELRRTQEELEKSRQRFTDLYDFAPVGYLTISANGLILEANLTAVDMFGVQKRNLIKLPLTAFISQNDQDIFYLSRKNLLESKKEQICELHCKRADASLFYAQLKNIITPDVDGNSGQFRIVITDITEQKQAAAERERLIVKLQKALDEIKTLRGIIPICSYCRQIRDDKGIWDKIEAYITEHTDSKFSHGICPDCYKTELDKLNNND